MIMITTIHMLRCIKSKQHLEISISLLSSNFLNLRRGGREAAAMYHK